MAGTTTTGGAPSFKRTLGRRTIETAGLFTISEIIQGLEKIPPAPQFLKNILFPAIETVWGEQIAVEFQRGSTRAAVFCTPYKRAIAQPRERFRTSWVTPPTSSSPGTSGRWTPGSGCWGSRPSAARRDQSPGGGHVKREFRRLRARAKVHARVGEPTRNFTDENTTYAN